MKDKEVLRNIIKREMEAERKKCQGYATKLFIAVIRMVAMYLVKSKLGYLIVVFYSNQVYSNLVYL
jgi:hypothetical protein